MSCSEHGRNKIKVYFEKKNRNVKFIKKKLSNFSSFCCESFSCSLRFPNSNLQQQKVT